jgi:hypothetical protein
VQILLTPRLPVPLAIAVPLLVALLVCQPGTGLHLLLAVAMPLLVCQPSIDLCVLFAVTVSLLLLLLVCQPGTGLCVLLAVAVPLLLSGCGGHAVQIVPLAVGGRQLIPGSGIHNSRSASRRNVLHEELQGGELHRHRWLSGGSQGP